MIHLAWVANSMVIFSANLVGWSLLGNWSGDEAGDIYW